MKIVLVLDGHRFWFFTNPKAKKVIIEETLGADPLNSVMHKRLDKDIARVIWTWLRRGGYQHDLENCSCDRCMDAMAAAAEREVERQQEMWSEGRR